MPKKINRLHTLYANDELLIDNINSVNNLGIVVENTVSRSAKAFGITSDGDTNIRVLLALAFRTHYGDAAFDRLGLPCSHMELNGEGQAICNRDVH